MGCCQSNPNLGNDEQRLMHSQYNSQNHGYQSAPYQAGSREYSDHTVTPRGTNVIPKLWIPGETPRQR